MRTYQDSDDGNSSVNATLPDDDDEHASIADPFPYWHIYIPLGIIGTFANLAVLVLVLVRKVIPGRVPRWLLINQSTSQMLCCLLNATKWLIGYNYSVPANGWGTLLCHTWSQGFLFWSIVQVSLDNLIVITLEQYMSVLYRARHRRVFSACLTSVYISMSWILAFFIQSGTLFEAARINTTCVYVRLDVKVYYFWGTFIFATFVIPLAAMLICYGRMIAFLRRQAVTLRIRRDSFRGHIARELAITVMVSGCTYLCCFAPNSFAYYLHALGVIQLDFEGWFYTLTEFLINFNFVLSPFIYAVKLRSLRASLARLCCSSARHSTTPAIAAATKFNSKTTSTFGKSEPCLDSRRQTDSPHATSNRFRDHR